MKRNKWIIEMMNRENRNNFESLRKTINLLIQENKELQESHILTLKKEITYLIEEKNLRIQKNLKFINELVILLDLNISSKEVKDKINKLIFDWLI